MNSSSLYFLDEFKLYDIQDMTKVRIPPEGEDGGYVYLHELLHDVDAVYSYGVGPDHNSVLFELGLQEYNPKIIRMYDHTVDGPRDPVPNSVFYKEGVGPKKTAELDTIKNHVLQNDEVDKNIILKLDIEGCEWDILHAIEDDTLSLFTQLSIEYHLGDTDGRSSWLMTVGDHQKWYEVLNKVNKNFYMFHVHANNVIPPNCGLHDPLNIPPFLEVSYVRKDLVKALPSESTWPTKIDTPNMSHHPDITMDRWPFYRGTRSEQEDWIKQHPNKFVGGPDKPILI